MRDGRFVTFGGKHGVALNRPGVEEPRISDVAVISGVAVLVARVRYGARGCATGVLSALARWREATAHRLAGFCRRWTGGLALMAVALGLAGCGSETQDRSADRTVAGEARQSPDRIALDMAVALKSVHSFRFTGTVTGTDGGSFTGEIAGPERAMIVEHRASGSLEALTLGAETYLRAAKAYWMSRPDVNAAKAAQLAGRWLELPTASAPGLTASLSKAASLGALSVQCVQAEEAEGSFLTARPGTFEGHQVVILVSNGSVPGTAPKEIDVAATGPPLPLHVITTGPRKPGGPKACPSDATKDTGELTITDVNRPIQLTAPTGAIDLGGMSRSASHAGDRIDAAGGGFTTIVPRGFVTLPTSASQRYLAVPVQLQYLVAERPMDGFATTVNVVRGNADHLDVDTAARAGVHDVVLAEASAHKFSRLRPTTVGGEPARAFDYFVAPAAGRVLHLKQVIVIHGDWVYTITYTALPGGYSESLAALAAIIRAWRWQ
jgi:hypothetical protein